jgi:hypothetical protein
MINLFQILNQFVLLFRKNFYREKFHDLARSAAGWG